MPIKPPNFNFPLNSYCQRFYHIIDLDSQDLHSIRVTQQNVFDEMRYLKVELLV